MFILHQRRGPFWETSVITRNIWYLRLIPGKGKENWGKPGGWGRVGMLAVEASWASGVGNGRVDGRPMGKRWGGRGPGGRAP